MANVVGNLTIDSQYQAQAQWTLGNADTGGSVKMQRWADKWAQATGTFGGATATVQVSNDNTNWVGATTDGSTACTFTVAGFKRVFENSAYIRVISSGGAGTTIVVTAIGSA